MEKDQITITKANLDKAYALADDNTKAVLDALFGKGGEDEEQPKPTLDDYTTIKSYEDACIALGETPIFKGDQMVIADEDYDTPYTLPSHIEALLKLETISRALWGRDFKPMPDAEGDKWYYYPWFYIWSQDEIDQMSDSQKEGVLLFGAAGTGASAGFGCANTTYRSSDSLADIGFRLCQESETKAAYFGTQFKELWAEYLLIH